ncbi:histidine kinase [Duganella sp. FT92W]|uniref:Histidine kinase n=1 Tax=Pseudoduganella rivuli TaxID=2666085 RepID=A0A7X2IUM3_9BURK|nr:CHASE domain-containing protein [Pseudoduganella rivuli]MRV76348.1 histidine kinase [Pseudoduganella rivuli]
MPLNMARNRLFAPTKPLWWSGVLLSLGVGVLLYGATARSLDSEVNARFRSHARNSQYIITNAIKAYTDVLRGAASYFQSADTITRDGFHRYVRGLDLPRHFPAITTLNYAQHVPAGAKPEAAIITLLEPLAGLEGKVGFDIAARPAVARALARGRDTGMLTSSGVPIGLDDNNRDAVLAMRMPVYRPNLPLATIEQRRAAYVGSIGIGFSVYRLVLGALEEMPVRNTRLILQDIGDQESEGNHTLLFDSMERGMGGPAEQDTLSYILPIDFNGRVWRAEFTASKHALYSHFDMFLPWLALLTGFCGSMLIYALFHTLSSSRLRAIRMAKSMTKELRDSQAKLQLSHHKLRRLAAHAEQIKEQERKRIAREIHDDLGQNLLALRIEADVLTTRTSHRHPRLHARARGTLAQIDHTIRSVRQIINDLRPNVLDLGLGAAVEWQIAQFRQRSGIVCEFIESGGDEGIDDHCATAYFRILQESLSNVLQHAHASLVKVELRRENNMLSMTISDNGVGLHARSRNKFGSFGLVGIEERINLLGGTCSIHSAPGTGTVVRVSAPLLQPGAAYPRLEQFA